MRAIERGLAGILTVGLAAVVLGATGCRSDKSWTQQWHEREVASNVKKELSKDPQYKFTDVQPVVHEGTVQLSGFVDTPEQRQRAAELAAQAKGVKEVINSIAIRPTPTGPNGRAPIREGPGTTTPSPGQTPTQPSPGQSATPPQTPPQPPPGQTTPPSDQTTPPPGQPQP